jgi:preprotein translocase subunit YajC
MGIMLPMLIVVFGLFWWMNRSEKKKRSQLEEQLKKGDKVLTRAGFIGKLVEVGETRCRVELAPGVNVTMVKQAIEGLADDEKKEPAKDDKAKDDKALVASDKSDTDSKTDRKKKKK